MREYKNINMNRDNNRNRDLGITKLGYYIFAISPTPNQLFPWMKLGRTFPSGPCAEGFVCIEGASEPSPADGLKGYPCPPGFFCSVGTSAPKACPKGTYRFTQDILLSTKCVNSVGSCCSCVVSYNSDKTGLVEESQCKSCIPGFHCSETGLSSVSGPCLAGEKRKYSLYFRFWLFFVLVSFKILSPGFYCLEGSQTATPRSDLSGDLCPVGHYCPEGSSVPTPCPAGSFQNDTGRKRKDDCRPCPFGE